MAQPVVTHVADSIFAWEVRQGDYTERFPEFRDATAFARLAATHGWDFAANDAFGYNDEGPTCSICDGLHGGFCPLENRGWDEGPGHAWEM